MDFPNGSNREAKFSAGFDRKWSMTGRKKDKPEIPVVLPGSGRGKDIFIVLLFLSLVAVLYFNSLGNGFTNWDDGMIYANPAIRSLDWKSVLDLLRSKRQPLTNPSGCSAMRSITIFGN